jgi:hypothetical protein
MKKLNIAVALVACAQLASAQGTDTCTTPTPAVGPGPWAFDNTAGTTGPEGQTEGICLQFGSTVLKRDVWFTWNATFSGSAIALTCGLSGVDTKIAVYPGTTCPTAGTGLGCNDDACTGFQSITNAFPVVLGQNYVIQVGVYPVGTTPGGIGSFDIMPVTVPSNDNCATPLAIAAPGQYPYDNSYASRDVNVGQNETTCLLNTGTTPIYRDLWYTYTATSTSVEVKTCDLVNSNSYFTDTRIAVYNGAGCPAANSSFGCEDDNTTCVIQALTTDLVFTATCGATYTIQIGNYNLAASVSGMVEFAEVGAPCSVGTPECFGDTAALCPCTGGGGSGIPNPGATGHGCGNSSFPTGAKLTASGFALDNPGDSLVLTCTNMPGPGLFFQSNGLVGPLLNFNDGSLCAASGIIRMGVVFPTAGTASYPGGLTPNPIHVAGAPVLVGGSPTPDTKHYQCWYRDITVGFCNTAGHNMSNGLAIVWMP